MNVIATLRFASHRLPRPMCWTFHVLGLANMNVVVTLHFIAPRNVVDVSCVTVPLSNMNVLAVLRLCVHQVFFIALDISYAVTLETFKNE